MDDHRPDNEFEGRTYLYIRTHPADDGSEPLAAGLKHWQSPDIMIEQPGGALGTEAIANSNNTVHVTVTNAGGIQATDAYLEAFFGNPSTGFTPATATPIGNAFLTLPGYSTQTAQFPWVPSSADAGHRCLIARVCLTLPFDCYVNGSVFDVKGDRHVAQRNIHVVAPKEEDETIEGFGFGFDIVNPVGRGGAFMIQAMEVRDADELETIQRALGCGFAQLNEEPLEQVGMILGGRLPPNDPSVPEQERELPTGVIPNLTQGDDGEQEFDMDVDDVLSAAITIYRNPDARPGTLNLVEIVQTELETNEIVGGLWVVVQN